ncbi:unnamed protein product [Spirodela intermedia]|uniref:Uncharacterized protein n=1 Tax=Spirodela intermedia TaxID=51605 RepID=A0ABN7E802_SPIIN|nr:unnamed protein product [Spirodela intermedia]
MKRLYLAFTAFVTAVKPQGFTFSWPIRRSSSTSCKNMV